jgi:hypothetical protein
MVCTRYVSPSWFQVPPSGPDGPLGGPTESPQVRARGGDPHKKPTYRTALPGTAAIMVLLALTSLYAGSAGLAILKLPVVRASTDLLKSGRSVVRLRPLPTHHLHRSPPDDRRLRWSSDRFGTVLTRVPGCAAECRSVRGGNLWGDPERGFVGFCGALPCSAALGGLAAERDLMAESAHTPVPLPTASVTSGTPRPFMAVSS